MKPKKLESLAWILIYSGLLLGALGLFLRDAMPLVGLLLMIAGGLDAVSGAVAIFIRSKMSDPKPNEDA